MINQFVVKSNFEPQGLRRRTFTQMCAIFGRLLWCTRSKVESY